MKPTTAHKLFLFGVQLHAVALGITLICGYLLINGGGCTNVKGPESAKRTGFSKTSDVSTTQNSSSATADRQATTRSSGGESRDADWRADVAIGRDGVRVSAVDHSSATTQPNTVAIARERLNEWAKLYALADTRATTQSSDDVRAGPSYSGPGGKIAVDADTLTAEAVKSKLAERWLAVVILVGVGLIFHVLPPPKGSVLVAFACYGAAAASLVVSNFWFVAVCAAPAVIILWPHLRTSKLYTRLVAQMEDWKSDMPAGTAEREAFDDTLAIAARGATKFVDQVRVAAKHAKVAVPVPSVRGAR